MYSVVLVMALAGSADAPDCCNRNNCGCMGFVSQGCFGCQGCFGGGFGCRGCYGCMGCQGCYGCQGGYGGMVIQQGGAAQPMPQGTIKKDYYMPVANRLVPATMVVNLPADAKLIINGYVSTQTTAVRNLVTPPLQPGQEFTYTLVAEGMENGQPISQTQNVTVRAGQQTPVTFNLVAEPAATNR